MAARGLPVVAAEQGQTVDDALVILLRLAIPVFTFVVVAIVYSAVRFRVPPGDALDSTVQSRGDRRFSWGWVAVTSALTVLLIVYPGITGLRSLQQAESAPNRLTVNVTASQWKWRFAYPAQRLGNQQELVLPVGRPVRFVLRSPDVIHSFWVPAFRIKQDVVPGEVRELSLTPNRLIATSVSPLARVQCAELCGVGHANMQARVRVVSPAAFDAWVRAQGGMAGAG